MDKRKKHNNKHITPVCPYCGNELPQYLPYAHIRCHFCRHTFNRNDIVRERQ